MIVNAASLTSLFTEFKALFDATFKGAPNPFDLKRFTMFVPTNTISVNYGWLGELPGMRRWIGDRQINELDAKQYSVSNVPYETTLGVAVRDIESDNLGVYRPRVQGLARVAAQHPFRLFAAALEDNPLCADGQNLIDTDHPKDDGTTWSNKSTTALSATSFDAAMVQGATVTDAKGDPAGIKYDVLMVPPALESTAIGIVGVQTLANGASNPNYGRVEIVVNPFLTDATNWYLFDTKVPYGPVIHQERKAATYAEDDSQKFSKGQVLHGVDGDYTMAAGLPFGLHGAIVAG